VSEELVCVRECIYVCEWGGEVYNACGNLERERECVCVGERENVCASQWVSE